MLTLARAAQGIFAAFITPVARLLVIKLFIKRRAYIFAKLTSIFLLGPLLGPLFGGAITTWLSWRLIFFVNIPIGITALIIIYTRFPIIEHKVTSRFDILGFLLLATALLTALFTIDTLTAATVATHFKAISICVSTLLFFLYYFHNKYKTHPVINLSVFQNKIYRFFILTLTSVRLLAMNMGFIGPLYVQTQLHYSAIQSGLVLTPLIIGAMLATRSINRLMDNFSTRTALMIVLILLIISQCIIADCLLHFSLYPFLLALFATGWASAAFLSINGQHLYSDLTTSLQSAGAVISSAILQLSRGFAIVLVALVLIVSSGQYVLDWQTTLPKSSFAIVMWGSASLLCIPLLLLIWMPKIPSNKATQLR